MGQNRGKPFEKHIEEAFNRVAGVSVDRIHDQTTRFKGSKNVSDYIVYKRPHEYYIECKSTTTNTLSFAKITQWDALLEKSNYDGVISGVMIWFINRDVTMFIPIQSLEIAKHNGCKSVPYNCLEVDKGKGFYGFNIAGRKKKVYFDYDMTKFFEDVENSDLDIFK